MTIRDPIPAWLSLTLCVVTSWAYADEPPVPLAGSSNPIPTAAPPVAAARAPNSAPAVPAASPASATAGSALGVITPKLQAQSVTIALTNGTTMTGTLSEADQWTMKTSLGTTSLPLSAVAGLRMAQEGSATTTVVLHNGDSITGAVQLDQVAIQTEWGRAEIFGTHVASILFTPGLKWSSETGLNGVRWKLVPDESRPAATTPANSANSAAASVATQPRVVAPTRPGRP